MESRAVERVAPELPPHRHALRLLRGELPRLCAPRLHQDSAEVLFMRPLLVSIVNQSLFT